MNPNETYTPPQPIAPETSPGGPIQPEKSSIGPAIGVIVIVIILIIGAFYFWNRSLELREGTPSEDTVVADLENTSQSDEINALEADLSNTGLDSIDAELEGLDAELQY